MFVDVLLDFATDLQNSSSSELPFHKAFAAARDGKTIELYAVLSVLTKPDQEAVLANQTTEQSQTATPFLIAARNGHSKTTEMLLKHFAVDIEQTGVFKFDGHSIDSATALWCAAADGHLGVIKVLARFKADLNHATKTNSTPLRAACYDGHIKVVEFLLQSGADLNIANRFQNTCLMIACYRGHLNVVSCLLKHGADPDVTSQSRETALHFAVERGYLSVIQELLRFNAKLLPSDKNLTPLLAAANNCQQKVVNFLVQQSCVTRQEKIDAFELLGASFGNDKETYNIAQCFEYLQKGLELRCDPSEGVMDKAILPPIEAYGNRVESRSLLELQSIRDDYYALHMEALIVRERILTENHEYIPHPIIYRGAVFADTEEYERCILLWMRAMQLRQRNELPIHKDLLRFAQLFSQMVRMWVGFEFKQGLTVFRYCYEELVACKEDRHKLENACCECRCAVENAESNFEMNVLSALYLLHLLCHAQGTVQEKEGLYGLVYKLNQLFKTEANRKFSPLHMACDHTVHVDDFYVNEVVKFPCAKVVSTLLQCGADPNCLDKDGNTPLHVIVRYDQPMSDFNNLHDTIAALMKYGAHVDRVNNQRQTAIEVSTTSVADVIIFSRRQLSLQCIAARAVKKYSIDYENKIPCYLKEFVDMH